ncbi:MAG TPA: DNA mismatch repair endonuclease MutL [Cytophagales bacterium]|nr:DNA mismatch repair endonuclease MutL [Cytophagales bacterium]HAA18298.1 DNA mismatch repair endonuclease MutL [Cytophagales bacterium]
MPDIIQLLPDAIANQIAAGEVVQRPASVVKELLENSLDAGATQITLVVKESGKNLIQVTDNGKGMSATDARMSFERHATSKISESDDLFRLRTMGFRGEALASIAAVAQVELKTRVQDEELGTLICIEGSEVKKQEACSVPVGTTLSVKNLFYNVPARRNFLKSNPVELRHIVDEFTRIALACPDISMTMFQNDLELFQLKAGKLSQRIVGIFGANYREQLAVVEENTPLLKVQGYIGKPEFAKRTRGEQFFFVNGRFIKSSYLNHAVTNAYDNLLAEGTYPFYVLYLQLDPAHIDVNVHPTKTEIKFDDERTIYGLIQAAIKQALATHNITPSLDFSLDVNFQQGFSGPPPVQVNTALTSTPSTSAGSREERTYSSMSNVPRFRSAEGWEKLYPEPQLYPQNQPDPTPEVANTPPSAGKTVTLQSGANRPLDSNGDWQATQGPKPTPVQLHLHYIITQVKSGMMLIDQQAAHERILYERFLQQLEKQRGACQQMLFPETLALNGGDFALVMEMKDEIRALGFEFGDFGQNTLVINGFPADLPHGDGKRALEGLLEQFKQNQLELSLDRRENLARSLSKRTSLKVGQPLTQEEMNHLIDQLFACTQPQYAPNGQRTFAIFDLQKIAGLF